MFSIAYRRGRCHPDIARNPCHSVSRCTIIQTSCSLHLGHPLRPGRGRWRWRACVPCIPSDEENIGLAQCARAGWDQPCRARRALSLCEWNTVGALALKLLNLLPSKLFVSLFPQYSLSDEAGLTQVPTTLADSLTSRCRASCSCLRSRTGLVSVDYGLARGCCC